MFSVKAALETQKQQRLEWKDKLNTDCYHALSDYLTSENAKLNEHSSGFDVVRGTKIHEFVFNWKRQS